jgi:hypothetical protein
MWQLQQQTPNRENGNTRHDLNLQPTSGNAAAQLIASLIVIVYTCVLCRQPRPTHVCIFLGLFDIFYCVYISVMYARLPRPMHVCIFVRLVWPVFTHKLALNLIKISKSIEFTITPPSIEGGGVVVKP